VRITATKIEIVDRSLGLILPSLLDGVNAKVWGQSVPHGLSDLVLHFQYVQQFALQLGCVWQLLWAHFGGLIWPTLERCGLGKTFALPSRKNKEHRRSCGNVGIRQTVVAKNRPTDTCRGRNAQFSGSPLQKPATRQDAISHTQTSRLNFRAPGLDSSRVGLTDDGCVRHSLADLPGASYRPLSNSRAFPSITASA
jgi:hypothetical protein